MLCGDFEHAARRCWGSRVGRAGVISRASADCCIRRALQKSARPRPSRRHAGYVGWCSADREAERATRRQRRDGACSASSAAGTRLAPSLEDPTLLRERASDPQVAGGDRRAMPQAAAQAGANSPLANCRYVSYPDLPQLHFHPMLSSVNTQPRLSEATPVAPAMSCWHDFGAQRRLGYVLALAARRGR